MKKVVLLSYHYYDSKRRAGFHHLADAFHKIGWKVVFFTTGISRLSFLGGNFRATKRVRAEANKLLEKKEDFYSYVWYTPWHPVNFRNKILNAISLPLFKNYGKLKINEKKRIVDDADMFIFESASCLFLVSPLKKINPNASYIYRVSDDLRGLSAHPSIIQTEKEIIREFDVISVTCNYVKNVFNKLYGNLNNLFLHYHGINYDLFSKPMQNPYQGDFEKNIIYVGNSYVDTDFINTAADLYPQWGFHVIGPISGLNDKGNIVKYGEMPFVDTIPYIKHADIGLQARTYVEGLQCVQDSLKAIQYTFFKLPIITTSFLQTERKNAFYYNPGDTASIKKAFEGALNFKREDFIPDKIYTWEEIANTLIVLSKK